MRFANLLLTLIILAVFGAAAFGQYTIATDMQQSSGVKKTAYSDDYIYFAPNGNASPAAGAATEPEKKTEAAPEAKKEEEKKDESSSDEESAPEPHRLIGKLGCTKINITGWLDMGGTANFDNPASRYNGTLAPNDRNEFQFNQFYWVFERPLDTADCKWDIGGRIDLLYGTD